VENLNRVWKNFTIEEVRAELRLPQFRRSSLYITAWRKS
jgi:hypothetical protein